MGYLITGIKNAKEIYWNLTTPALYEHICRNGEGQLSHLGPVVVATGEHTGRAPNDKFIVKEPTSQDHIWWGKVNKPISPEIFDDLLNKAINHFNTLDNVYLYDGWCGANKKTQKQIKKPSHPLYITKLAF